MPKRILPRIVEVAADNKKPLTLHIRWDSGDESRVDVSGLIETFHVYKPLRRSQALFRRVGVGEHGTDVVWSDEVDRRRCHRRQSGRLSLRTGSMTKKHPKRSLPPMHPGELLREEILPALDRPKTEIAKLLGVSRQTLYDILDEKQPVTPVMALRLGKLCGNGPDLWLNLQKRYDLQRAEQELREKIKAIPTLQVA